MQWLLCSCILNHIKATKRFWQTISSHGYHFGVIINDAEVLVCCAASVIILQFDLSELSVHATQYKPK
jgi:hypothetical protein